MTANRTLAALRALIAAELPRVDYLAAQEYRVTALGGNGTIDAAPVDPASPLPAIVAVPTLMPFGISPAIGDVVVVRFLDGDPTRPRIRACTVPPRLNLGGSGGADAAGKGDEITWKILPMVVTFVSGVPPLAPPVAPSPANIGVMIPLVPEAFGSITIGSQRAGVV